MTVSSTHTPLDAPGDSGVRIVAQVPTDQKLRVSLTAACNYSCFFCHNEGSLPEKISSSATLLPKDLAFVARVAVDAGIRSLKLTGGEPLLYRSGRDRIEHVVRLVRGVADPEALDLSITTNGQLLKSVAPRLREAGLSRLTVSLHTADSDTFRRDISAAGSPKAQLAGIRSAIARGISVKANVLVMKENLAEVPLLMSTLNELGVQQVRFYRLLWSPLLGDRLRDSRISDEAILHLAEKCTGVRLSQTDLEWAIQFLAASSGQHHGRTLSVGTADRQILIDAMPAHATPADEGDYALRLTARGGLRAHLFGDEVDLLPSIKARSLSETSTAIRRARAELQS